MEERQAFLEKLEDIKRFYTVIPEKTHKGFLHTHTTTQMIEREYER